MRTWEQIEAQVEREIREGEGFDCPKCGARHELSDSEVAMGVISYWGEDDHHFSCQHCDTDFLVREHVTRRFETSVSREGFDC